MPKQKTHRGAAKRFRVTRTGKIVHRRAGRGHKLEKKRTSTKRRLARSSTVGPERATILRVLGRR